MNRVLALPKFDLEYPYETPSQQEVIPKHKAMDKLISTIRCDPPQEKKLKYSPNTNFLGTQDWDSSGKVHALQCEIVNSIPGTSPNTTSCAPLPINDNNRNNELWLFNKTSNKVEQILK